MRLRRQAACFESKGEQERVSCKRRETIATTHRRDTAERERLKPLVATQRGGTLRQTTTLFSNDEVKNGKSLASAKQRAYTNVQLDDRRRVLEQTRKVCQDRVLVGARAPRKRQRCDRRSFEQNVEKVDAIAEHVEILEAKRRDSRARARQAAKKVV